MHLFFASEIRLFVAAAKLHRSYAEFALAIPTEIGGTVETELTRLVATVGPCYLRERDDENDGRKTSTKIWYTDEID